MPRVPKEAGGASTPREEAQSQGVEVGKPVRRDVVRNRRRVIDAASEAFAEHGVDVGYDLVALRAGVGVGTVYRHFSQRSELVLAVFESRIDNLVEFAAAALGQPTGALGLQWFLEQVLAVQSRDRGMRDVLAGRVPQDERMRDARKRMVPAVEKLIERAKHEQALRPDIETTDIAALAMALSLLSSAEQPDLWRRYLVLFLDALVPHRAGITPLPLSAPLVQEFNDLTQGP